MRLGPNNYVYFVRDNQSGLIKIGQSKSPQMRVASFGPSEQFDILGTLQAPDREQELHELFAEFRVKGEWFRPAPRLMAYIRLVKQRPDLYPRYKRTIPYKLEIKRIQRRSAYEEIGARIAYWLSMIDLRVVGFIWGIYEWLGIDLDERAGDSL